MFHKQYKLLRLVRTKNMHLRNYNAKIGFFVFAARIKLIRWPPFGGDLCIVHGTNSITAEKHLRLRKFYFKSPMRFTVKRM